MKKILIGLMIAVLLAATAVGFAVASFDINQHRAAIEAALSQETGRSVKLGGAIHIGLSLHGLTVAIPDVDFGNPPWASRPNMASIKKFELKVGLIPLLAHRIDINGLVIEDADILIESQNEFRHNWDKYEVGEAAPAGAPAAKADKIDSEIATPASINIANLSIRNSRIGWMGPDRTITVFEADDVSLGAEGSGLALHFKGRLDDAPIDFTLTTNAATLLSGAARPITLDLVLANLHLTAGGIADMAGKKLELASYQLTAGDSKLYGALTLNWSGAQPDIKGTFLGDKLVPSDFVVADGTSENTPSANANTAKTPQRIFTDTPLPFDMLKAVDMHLDVGIATLAAGKVELSNIRTKLVVDQGRLFAVPLSMTVGAGTINGQFNLDANATPPHIGGSFAMEGVELGDIIKLGGAEAFLAGKVKADINLVSNGKTLHELAGNLTGPISLIGTGGDVISSVQGKLESGLSEILAPGTAKNDGMNCVVARFIAQNGVVKGNGILIDTSEATAAGYGDIDLRSETINLDFHAKPKAVNIGGLLPVVHIGGTLSQPDYHADPNQVVQNVGSLLTGNGITDPVPDVQTKAGQNACAYALDHAAVTAPADKGGVVQDLAGKAGTLLKNLFAK